MKSRRDHAGIHIDVYAGGSGKLRDEGNLTGDISAVDGVNQSFGGRPIAQEMDVVAFAWFPCEGRSHGGTRILDERPDASRFNAQAQAKKSINESKGCQVSNSDAVPGERSNAF